MSEIKQFQIFGQRASGTHYLINLLERNLNLKHNKNQPWKHGFSNVSILPKNVDINFVIYRNPYDWIRSVHILPYHAIRSLWYIPFEEFIRREWECDDKFDLHPESGKRFSNILKLRSYKIKLWESKRSNKVCYLNYEILEKYPEQVLDDVAKRYNLKWTKNFENIYTRKDHNAQYVKKQYRPLTQEDLDYLKNEIDWVTENQIGYRLEDYNILKNTVSLPHLESYIF